MPYNTSYTKGLDHILRRNTDDIYINNILAYTYSFMNCGSDHLSEAGNMKTADIITCSTQNINDAYHKKKKNYSAVKANLNYFTLTWQVSNERLKSIISLHEEVLHRLMMHSGSLLIIHYFPALSLLKTLSKIQGRAWPV